MGLMRKLKNASLVVALCLGVFAVLFAAFYFCPADQREAALIAFLAALAVAMSSSR